MVSAQNLFNADHPAEFPPASYTGKQYVDSKGCVFVRAGFDGAVTWVPRVNRKRTVLCGFEPTFARAATPAPAPRVAEAPAVTAPRPVAPKPAPVQAPLRRTVMAAPATRVTTPAPRVTKPAPAPVQVAVAPPRTVVRGVVAPPTTARPAPTQLARAPAPAPTGTTACPEASQLSQKYLLTGTHRVRCGPQGVHPATVASTVRSGGVRGAAAPNDGPALASTIRVPAPPVIAPPEGYQAAFDDGRFNPNRGLGTRVGHEQMRLVWTSGVPRRLVDQNTGRDVTRLFPGLRFPFISLGQQKKYVSANGWPPASGVVVSAKNTPPAATVAPATAGHRFVQVGTFGVRSNAQASAARLQALGLPVRIGAFKKNGKTYRIVLAGPFVGAAQLQAGLTAARRAGFADAFTRK